MGYIKGEESEGFELPSEALIPGAIWQDEDGDNFMLLLLPKSFTGDEKYTSVWIDDDATLGVVKKDWNSSAIEHLREAYFGELRYLFNISIVSKTLKELRAQELA